MTRKATKDEEAVAQDEAAMHSLLTGEVLRSKALCPLVVIRSRDSGVHVGYLARYGDGEVELVESRRIWSWTEGPPTLNELAETGLPGKARISKPVRHICILDACEVIAVSHEAAKTLTNSRWEA
jgi:hypothetical protein